MVTGLGTHHEHVLGAVDVGPQAVERLLDDELDAHRGGQVEDPVDLRHALQHDRGVEDGALHELETRVVAHPVKVGQVAGAQVVEHENGVALGEQVLDEVASDESGAAGDE